MAEISIGLTMAFSGYTGIRQCTPYNYAKQPSLIEEKSPRTSI